jgi:DNA polymerase I
MRLGALGGGTLPALPPHRQYPARVPRPTLYIIDAYAQFFRAYHAIRTPMTSPVTKEPTNMSFGFLGMLIKLLRGEGPAMQAWGGRPTYLCVALDVGGDRGTFRSQLYPQYKANRSEPPEDLEPQVERCLALLRAAQIPVLGSEGFEADDVFATLVRSLRATHADLRIRMVSKDKDLKQLLANDSVELFDVHTDTPFGEGELREQLGIGPGQVIDLLTLMGDTSDNVPGVEGVGEKTAALLLKEFGSLDVLLARASEVKGKRGEKLREAMPTLGLSRQLVTLRDDVPLTFDLGACDTTQFALRAFIAGCKELGFNRYQAEFRGLLGEPESASDAQSTAQSAASTDGLRERGVASLEGGFAMLARGEGNPKAAASLSAGLSASQVKSPASKKASKTLAPAPLFEQAELAGPEADQPVRTAQSGTYNAMCTREALRAFVAAAREAASRGAILALDTETTGLDPRRCELCGLSLSFAAGTGVYVPTRSPAQSEHLSTDDALRELRPLLEDAGVRKCGHNIKFDMLVLRANQVTLRGVAFDSMVASYLIDASRSSHGLDSLALALLGRTNISLSELLGSGKDMRTFDTVPLAQATQYAAEDADVALQLHDMMEPRLRSMGLAPLFERVEMPLVGVLAEMEWNGIAVDAQELERQRRRLASRLEGVRAQLDAAAKASIYRTFDPDSPKQLSVALFASPEDDVPGLGIKPTKKTKTGFSTDAEVLEELASDPAITSPIPALILEHRSLSKLISTYLEALKLAISPVTGRVHSSFHQTVAATGRLASSDPNLQNIPIRTDDGREIRRAFVAPPGRVLVTADYSQIELRLLAHLSRDAALIDAFVHDADIHTAVAAQIHRVSPGEVTREQRSGAKMVNFGIVYGITPFGLARRLRIEQGEAAQIITGYKQRFAGITTFLQECVEQARSHGYVSTILGRRRPIPDIDSSNPSRRSLAERLAINSVVQGSAADLIKLAMVRVEARLEAARGTALGRQGLAGALLLLQIHDELVLECDASGADEVQRMLTHEMVHAMDGFDTLRVELKVDSHVAANWFDGK